MADELAIWLDGRVVAVVERDRQRLRLAYTPAVVSSVPGGTPLLSIQFPVSNRSFPNGVTRAFLDGLLPEGDSRRVIAEEFGLRSNDTFGLIRALGRDRPVHWSSSPQRILVRRRPRFLLPSGCRTASSLSSWQSSEALRWASTNVFGSRSRVCRRSWPFPDFRMVPGGGPWMALRRPTSSSLILSTTRGRSRTRSSACGLPERSGSRSRRSR